MNYLHYDIKCIDRLLKNHTTSSCEILCSCKIYSFKVERAFNLLSIYQLSSVFERVPLITSIPKHLTLLGNSSPTKVHDSILDFQENDIHDTLKGTTDHAFWPTEQIIRQFVSIKPEYHNIMHV